VQLVKAHGITAIADVRSSPSSRFSPQYNREAMVPALRQVQVRYVFLGGELGARRVEPECYTEGGKVNYCLVEQHPTFREGLERIRRGVQKFKIALLCAENDPLTCHRTILVAKQFREELDTWHILPDGSLESMQQTEDRLLKTVGTLSGDLFRSRTELIMQAYRIQGERIAYSARPELKKAATSND
jgi:uncharacterized protein (DUF488 family)